MPKINIIFSIKEVIPFGHILVVLFKIMSLQIANPHSKKFLSCMCINKSMTPNELWIYGSKSMSSTFEMNKLKLSIFSQRLKPIFLNVLVNLSKLSKNCLKICMRIQMHLKVDLCTKFMNYVSPLIWKKVIKSKPWS